MLLVGNWLLLRHFSFLILAAVAVATRILVFGPASLLVVADLLFPIASLSDQPSEPSFGESFSRLMYAPGREFKSSTIFRGWRGVWIRYAEYLAITSGAPQSRNLMESRFNI